MIKLIEHFGSQYRLAKELRVTRAYVSHWFRDGKVPPLQAIKIEEITGGKFKAIDLIKGE
tara:strand:+ start:6772 stop:6951 length:180 start_codon:yes stop_codon:yes gene_type:complete